ncbi:MAG: glycosyltransferase, partial [Acidobacteriota bacterium]
MGVNSGRGGSGRRLIGRAGGTLELVPRPFSDRPLRGVDLQIYGPLHGHSSMANVTRELARSLGRRLSIGVHSYSRGSLIGEDLKSRRGLDPGAPMALFYGLPTQVRDPVWGHGTRLLGFACESDRIPDSWAATCNRFHLVIVPSAYCERALRASGVEAPILVVHHGLEPCYVPGPPRSRGEVFTFFNVVHGNRPERKALRELLTAFGRAFGGRRDVRLRLQTRLTDKVRRAFREAGVSPHDPTLTIDERILDTENFAALYSAVHCTVHPSHSEGFGIIPLQSIACETPVIACAATGAAEYLNAKNAVLLQSKGLTEEPHVVYATGRHPLIDEEHLVDRLRHVESRWPEEVAKVRAAAP